MLRCLFKPTKATSDEEVFNFFNLFINKLLHKFRRLQTHTAFHPPLLFFMPCKTADAAEQTGVMLVKGGPNRATRSRLPSGIHKNRHPKQ